MTHIYLKFMISEIPDVCQGTASQQPHNNHKGAAFYASGNVASEALRLYSTD